MLPISSSPMLMRGPLDALPRTGTIGSRSATNRSSSSPVGTIIRSSSPVCIAKSTISQPVMTMAGEQPASPIDGGRSDSRSSSVCANELMKLLWRVAVNVIVVLVADASVAVDADVVVVVAVADIVMVAVVTLTRTPPAAADAAAAAALAFASAESNKLIRIQSK